MNRRSGTPPLATVYELTAPRTLVTREESVASRLEADELVAQAEVSVISPGTELAAWLGRPPLRPSTVYPRLLGYCHLARVTEVGTAVTDVQPGDRIVTHQAHRSAIRVRRDDVLLAISGADAENAQLCQALAATYLYHIGYVALMAGGFFPGHQVAVVGGGALGFAAAQLVRALGAAPVVFTSRATAGAEGDPIAQFTCLPKHAAEASFWGSLGGADLVIDTSDSWEDFRLSQQVARKSGTIVLLGFPGRGLPPAAFNPLDSQFMYDKQLTVRHSGHVPQAPGAPSDSRFTKSRNMAYLATLIRRGDLRVAELVGLVRPWRELAGVYAALESRHAGVYTAALDWRIE